MFICRVEPRPAGNRSKPPGADEMIRSCPLSHGQALCNDPDATDRAEQESGTPPHEEGNKPNRGEPAFATKGMLMKVRHGLVAGLFALMLLAVAAIGFTHSASAETDTLPWNVGQGFENGLPSKNCEGLTPGTMLWVFSYGGTGSINEATATLTLNGVVYPVAGVDPGQNVKFITPYLTQAQITSAFVTFDGTIGNGATIKVSHGCPGGIVEDNALRIEKSASANDVCDGASVNFTVTVINDSHNFT